MKKKIKVIVKLALLVVIVTSIFIACNKLFQPIWTTWNNYYTIYGFYEEPEDTIETVFLGRSVMASGVMPTQLYEEYGICSYNLATEAQPMLASYYWLEEAYRLHSESLNTVVLDVSGLRATSRDAFYHKALDGMKLSEVKYRAVKDYVGDDIRDILTYLTPLVTYHDRWSTLKGSEFDKYVSPVNGTRGFHYIEKIYKFSAKSAIQPLNTTLYENTSGDELVEDEVKYLDMMADFCEKNDIKLVLIKTPTLDWSSKLHNEVDSIAKEKELEFYDLNYEPLYSEMEFVHAYDTSEGYHPNYYGARKITSWIGKYLVEECGATDVRNLDGYEHMDEQLELYKNTVEFQANLEQTANVVEYVKVLCEQDAVGIITVNNEASKSLTKEQRDELAKMGLTKLSKIELRDSYIGIIKDGKVVKEEIKKYATIKDKETITYTAKFENGVEYTLESGGYSHGKKASIIIDGKEYAKNERGLNIVVYNEDVDTVLDSVVFDTYATKGRTVYKLDMAQDVLTNNEGGYDPESVEGQILLSWANSKYFSQNKDVKANQEKNQLTFLLDKYSKCEDAAIFIAVENEATKALTQADRQKFKEWGFELLPDLEFRDSYVAIIDEGKIKKEVRESGETKAVLTDTSLGVYICSGGFDAGATSSIKINDVECSTQTRGINIVVYDKKLKCVVTSVCYDTYKTPLYQK